MDNDLTNISDIEKSLDLISDNKLIESQNVMLNSSFKMLNTTFKDIGRDFELLRLMVDDGGVGTQTESKVDNNVNSSVVYKLSDTINVNKTVIQAQGSVPTLIETVTPQTQSSVPTLTETQTQKSNSFNMFIIVDDLDKIVANTNKIVEVMMAEPTGWENIQNLIGMGGGLASIFSLGLASRQSGGMKKLLPKLGKVFGKTGTSVVAGTESAGLAGMGSRGVIKGATGVAGSAIKSAGAEIFAGLGALIASPYFWVGAITIGSSGFLAYKRKDDDTSQYQVSNYAQGIFPSTEEQGIGYNGIEYGTTVKSPTVSSGISAMLENPQSIVSLAKDNYLKNESIVFQRANDVSLGVFKIINKMMEEKSSQGSQDVKPISKDTKEIMETSSNNALTNNNTNNYYTINPVVNNTIDKDVDFEKFMVKFWASFYVGFQEGRGGLPTGVVKPT